MRHFHLRMVCSNVKKRISLAHYPSCMQKSQVNQLSSLPAVTRTTKPLLMACLPPSSWKQELSTTAAFLRQFQQDKEFDVTKNAYFIKYSEKLKYLAKENPAEYEKRITDLENKLKEAEAKKKKDLSEPTEPRTGKAGSWPPKSLEEIMKVDLVQDKSPEEVEEIWRGHHLRKDGVFSVIKKVEFEEMLSNGKAFPTFIYALPRSDGYEFILSQFSESNVYFTSLQMFQSLKENAQPYLTIAHFPDLKDTKGIVLMAGRYDEKFLNQIEAVNLVKQMALFYGTESGDRRHLVETFNRSPSSFNHMDIIDEYKRIQQKVELFSG